MGHWIEIATRTGPIRGWRVEAAGQARGQLLVVQEIFGVNPHIRTVAERFAEHGFEVLAPALFDHFGEGAIELDYDQAGVARGRELVANLGFETALEYVAAARDALAGNDRVGVVGFCWGGTLAFLANTRLGLPAASYYGGRTMAFNAETLRAPMLFHYGERDPIIPAEHREAQIAAHPEAIAYVYPAGHGFNCDARADFEPESTALALRRSVDFFAQALA
jgi:carboxymethylenebutenolidase